MLYPYLIVFSTEDKREIATTLLVAESKEDSEQIALNMVTTSKAEDPLSECFYLVAQEFTTEFINSIGIKGIVFFDYEEEKIQGGYDNGGLLN